MRFTLLAVAVGLGAGLAAGGGLRHLSHRTFRAWPVLVAGVGLQATVRWSGGDAGGAAVLIVSVGLLLAFAVANLQTVGMWLVAVGLGLNLTVIALNGGMPVRPSALVGAGLADTGRADDVALSGRHHLERRSDRLAGLGDVIPLAPLREVISFGDLFMAVGTANVVFHLLAPAAGRRSRPAPSAGRTPPGRLGAIGAGEGRGTRE